MITSEQLHEVMLSAFADELQKIAAAVGPSSLQKTAMAAQFSEVLEMLKQAGLWDRVVSGAKGLAGKAKSLAGKAKDVVQNAGESGALRRMQAAGAAYDLEKANIKRLQELMHGPGAMRLERQAAHLPGAGFTSRQGQFIEAMPLRPEMMGAGVGGPHVAMDMPQFRGAGGRVLNPRANAPTPNAAQMAEAGRIARMRQAMLPPDLSAFGPTPGAPRTAVPVSRSAPAGVLRPAFA